MEQRKSTQELFNELTDRLIIPLKDNEIVCPTCKGLRFTYKQTNDKEGYIQTCSSCYNGKLYVCKHCGKSNKTDHCNCDKSNNERNIKFNQEQAKKEQVAFTKATKIKFKDYDGYFMLDDERVKSYDEIYDWLYDKIKYENLSDEELPKFLWGTKAESVFDLDIYDIILNKCEDGYEDMYSCLDTEDSDLEMAQVYLDNWYKRQGDSVNVYYEDYSVAVLLDDLIKEIREDIKKEGEQIGWSRVFRNDKKNKRI